MFQPPVFQENRTDVLQALMKEHPFATLISSAAGFLSADHIPLVLYPELSKNGILRGHLAAGNPLWRKTEGVIEVLAVFQGPQTYITPSWYPSKKEHGKVVPTWNYAVAHARGTLTFRRDADWLMVHLADLTNIHEKNRAAPWAVADAPPDFTARMLKGLVGFEINITALEGTWKMSQNKTEQDRMGVAQGLAQEPTSDAQAAAPLVTQGMP